ncbi:uncharacterized protein N7459_007551 [Penicillium hispanicum]|uniref:uncharacterized protein n=1 Tax=Penicillium hispanicum TaxID=1080232 RepID=UPI00253FDDE5|nr:uncharacterized protein N7459_007551 [Penicillium hispanicum]KAJ5578587.1 hypothetical protein N7459_007551 [Penicillium hispanicum]
MVYCGKPSKGCGQCRARKVRCDQARPACSQCVRVKRDCPGYRDQLSLMFRDESKDVVRKAKAESSSSRLSTSPARQKRPPVRSPRSPASPDGNAASALTVSESVEPEELIDFNADPQHRYLVQQLWNLPWEIQPSPEPSQQEVMSFFLRSNTLPGTHWIGNFATQILLQDGSSASNQAMQSSMVAVSSAMLARMRKMTALRDMARREYLSAITSLNIALANTEEAKSNKTLGAVVLLAVYEIITSRAPRDMELWTNHISGATALLELRGPDQLGTEAGLRLFLHLRYQIIVSCIQRDTRVPDSILECTKFVMLLRPAEAHSNRLIIIIGKLSNLRADIKDGKFANDEEIVSAASVIDAELITWLAAMPPQFAYETRTVSPDDYMFAHRCRGLAPYDDQYYVYSSFWVCSTWNQYRCARILVSEIILSHIRQISDASAIRPLSDEFRLHCKTLRTTIRRLAVDLCRGVPYHLGVHQEDVSPNFPPPESYLGGLMLLWPMFLAGCVENRHHALRNWVMKCLKVIGNSMALDLGLALRDVMATDPGILQFVTDSEEENCRIAEVPAWSMSVKRHPGSSVHSDYHGETPS